MCERPAYKVVLQIKVFFFDDFNEMQLPFKLPPEKGARDTKSIYLTPYKTYGGRFKSRFGWKSDFSMFCSPQTWVNGSSQGPKGKGY